MIKEATYQEKFEILKLWMEEIVDAVKKDLKNDHLAKDKTFCRRYFLGKNPSGVDLKSFSAAYAQEINAGNSALGEFIATRWLLKHTDIYGYFEGMLKKVSSEFETLQELDSNLSQTLVSESSAHFGAKNTYIFSILNSVVFPASIFDALKIQAEKSTHHQREELQTKQERLSMDEMLKRHDRELKAAKDRFEKKMIGLQKKYTTDTDNLKKRISVLEKQIAQKGI